LFRRLAVFAGGFTLEAAEAVGAEGDLVEVDVLDLVSLLVEKSLVVADLAVGRYRLLETVRQYAQERLDESLEGDRTRARHLAYYLAFAEEGEMKLRGPQQGVWLSRFADEQENLLSAHAWCDHADGGAQMGLTLAWAVQDYWFNRGLLELGHRLTVEAISRAGAMERNSARWRALATAGDLSYWMGRYGEATSYLEECLSIAP
jgi:predicted ATPase